MLSAIAWSWTRGSTQTVSPEYASRGTEPSLHLFGALV
jgi:hypothetical protein